MRDHSLPAPSSQVSPSRLTVTYRNSRHENSCSVSHNDFPSLRDLWFWEMERTKKECGASCRAPVQGCFYHPTPGTRGCHHLRDDRHLSRGAELAWIQLPLPSVGLLDMSLFKSTIRWHLSHPSLTVTPVDHGATAPRSSSVFLWELQKRCFLQEPEVGLLTSGFPHDHQGHLGENDLTFECLLLFL